MQAHFGSIPQWESSCFWYCGKKVCYYFLTSNAQHNSSTGSPKLHLDKDALSHKILWLRALADLYESQLPLFSTGSGQSFGRLEGSKVALFIETTEQLCRDESRLTSYKEAIGLLTREQLSGKETVQLFRFGSIVEPCSPGCLAFAADLERYGHLYATWPRVGYRWPAPLITQLLQVCLRMDLISRIFGAGLQSPWSTEGRGRARNGWFGLRCCGNKVSLWGRG